MGALRLSRAGWLLTAALACGPGALACGPGALACGPGALACGPGAPRLDAIEPALGDSDGGGKFRLVGAGFVGRGPVVVYLGKRSARAVVIVDDRLITAVAPEAEALGPTDLRLEFADGTVFERPGGYEYTSEDGVLKPIPFVPGQVPVPTAQ